jgi:hypothetical protein
MAGNPVSATFDASQWSFQENYVERLMDNAAFTAAHPNNTLVLAGPARFPKGAAVDQNSFGSAMLPVGMVQNMNIGQMRPVQPMQMIGSARTFFLAGKGQVTFNIGRLWVNGRNLLRVLYTQAKRNDLDVTRFGEPPVSAPGGSPDEQFYLNLDSELFYIPFGMAVLFRSVSHDAVGAFYIELCMLNSWATAFAAGQNLIMENVSGVADRIRPILPSSFLGPDNYVTSTEIISTVLKQDDGEFTNGPNALFPDF